MGSGASATGANDGVVITALAATGLPGDAPLGWTASASELSAQSGSWTLEVLRHLRDGKAASAQKRTRQRHLRGAAEAAPLSVGRRRRHWRRREHDGRG